MLWLTHKSTLPALVLAAIIVMRIFMVFPQIDVAVAELAYVNGAFIADTGGIIAELRAVTWNMALMMVVVAVIALSLGYTSRWPQRLLPIREWNIIFWSFLLGPGIVVNGILKSFIGRTRPNGLEQFGGDQFFSAVGEFNGLCKANCSFVSGEVSGITAFCIAGVILLQHHRARLGARAQAALYAGLGLAFAFVFAQRVLSGGHFLSDALLAAIYTALITALIAQYWPQTPEKLHQS
jgi:lipid A 4'-phosphatase